MSLTSRAGWAYRTWTEIQKLKAFILSRAACPAGRTQSIMYLRKCMSSVIGWGWGSIFTSWMSPSNAICPLNSVKVKGCFGRALVLVLVLGGGVTSVGGGVLFCRAGGK